MKNEIFQKFRLFCLNNKIDDEVVTEYISNINILKPETHSVSKKAFNAIKIHITKDVDDRKTWRDFVVVHEEISLIADDKKQSMELDSIENLKRKINPDHVIVVDNWVDFSPKFIKETETEISVSDYPNEFMNKRGLIIRKFVFRKLRR